MTEFALVVNPKTLRPYSVKLLDGNTVVEFGSALGTEVGNGYYEEKIRPSSEFSVILDPVLTSEIVKLPRFHCPEGVRPQNAGLGVVLYYGAAVLARYTKQEDVHSGGGRGICSGKDANEPAKEFWRKLVAKGYGKTVKYNIDDFKNRAFRKNVKETFGSDATFEGAYMTEASALSSKVVLHAHNRAYVTDIRRYLSLDYSRSGLGVKNTVRSILHTLGATDAQLARFERKIHPGKLATSSDEDMSPEEMFPDLQDMP